MAKRGNLRNQAQTKAVERPVRWRKYEEIFLIVCEDAVTEPAYFAQFAGQFPDETMYVLPIGTGRDPEGVVDRAIAEKARLQAESRKEIDYVWVVFDKDDADLNATRLASWQRAHQKISANRFRSAMSNEVFELWLLLHLQDVNAAPPIPRADIYQMLGAAINQHPDHAAYVYNHQTDGGAVIPIIAAIGNEAEAIHRAEILSTAHRGRPLIEANPSTRVHLLVGELRQWIVFYSWQPE